MRQITKEQQKLLEQGRMEGQGEFFVKSRECFRYPEYPESQYDLKHEAGPPYSMRLYGL